MSWWGMIMAGIFRYHLWNICWQKQKRLEIPSRDEHMGKTRGSACKFKKRKPMKMWHRHPQIEEIPIPIFFFQNRHIFGWICNPIHIPFVGLFSVLQLSPFNTLSFAWTPFALGHMLWMVLQHRVSTCSQIILFLAAADSILLVQMSLKPRAVFLLESSLFDTVYSICNVCWLHQLPSSIPTWIYVDMENPPLSRSENYLQKTHGGFAHIPSVQPLPIEFLIKFH